MIGGFLCFRVARREVPPLPVVFAGDGGVAETVGRERKAVVFYSDSFQPVKALKQTIERYNGDVRFVYSQPTEESRGFCLTTPCASAFVNGSHVRSTVFDVHPVGFEFWVRTTFGGDTLVEGPEHLRRVLQLPGPSVLAVDLEQRPPSVPREQQIFLVRSEDLRLMGVSAKKGLHVFRTADREFIHTPQWDPSALKSPLVDFGVDDIRKKQFLVGGFVDGGSGKQDQGMVQMMVRLENVFGGANMSFGIFTEDFAEEMGYMTRLSQICGPLIVVLNTSDLQGPRWTISGEDALSERKVAEKLSGIASKALRPEHLSLKPQGPARVGEVNVLTVDDFHEKIYWSEGISVVFMTTSCTETQKEFLALERAAARAYGKHGIQVFDFDQGVQDVVESIPLFSEYPQILGFRRGKGVREPLLYQADLSLMNFLDFVREVSGGEAELSEGEIRSFRDDLIRETGKRGRKRGERRESGDEL